MNQGPWGDPPGAFQGEKRRHTWPCPPGRTFWCQEPSLAHPQPLCLREERERGSEGFPSSCLPCWLRGTWLPVQPLSSQQ